MADGGYDPCECIWSHEQAMRRLISLLRNSQGYCTSDECFQDMPGPSNTTPTGGDSTLFLLMMGWIILAAVLFFLRPQSLRDRGLSKPSNNQGPNNPPADPVQ